jgi:hypothetical protein
MILTAAFGERRYLLERLTYRGLVGIGVRTAKNAGCQKLGYRGEVEGVGKKVVKRIGLGRGLLKK